MEFLFPVSHNYGILRQYAFLAPIVRWLTEKTNNVLSIILILYELRLWEFTDVTANIFYGIFLSDAARNCVNGEYRESLSEGGTARSKAGGMAVA